TGTDNQGKININTAAKEELKTLPGIGDAKADSIISYREANGGFQTVEELKQVEGIKEGVFNKIKDRVVS
ncbi:ComEA family DNA-binding protein, partial [Faecalicatena contorta]